MKDTLENQTHHLVPKGGIAKLSSKDDCIRCEDEKCKKNYNYTGLKSLFCTLPINLETGISGIINGNFILDSENRRALYNGEGTHKEWNQAILNHCVLPCFIAHLEFIKSHIEGKYRLQKEKNEFGNTPRQKEQPDEEGIVFLEKKVDIDNFLSLFPKTKESTDKYFKILTKTFYIKITDEGNRLLPVHLPGDVKFCSPREFLLFGETDSKCNLLKVMKMASLKVDVLPEVIIKDFSEAGTEHDYSLTIATPAVVRDLLKREKGSIFRRNGTELSNTSLKKVDSVNTLLSFCLKEENDNSKTNYAPSSTQEEPPLININGLPLCLRQDLTVKDFNSNDPIFLTKFSTLFDKEKSRFMHKSTFLTLSAKHIDQSCFKEFGLHQFKEMLQNSGFNSRLSNSKIGDSEDEKCNFKTWIKNCWGLIESCYLREKRKHKEEKKTKKEESDTSNKGAGTSNEAVDKVKEVQVPSQESVRHHQRRSVAFGEKKHERISSTNRKP